MTVTPPTLETERLILRPFRLEDFGAEAEYFASERSRHVGGPGPAVRAWSVFAGHVGHWQLRGYGMFAIEDKATGAYLGRSGPYYPAGWPEPEIGWTVMGPAEGRGIAFEAAQAARAWAYRTLGWTTAISLIAAGNERSHALARRMGAVREADIVHEIFGPMWVWRHPGPEALS